MMLSFRRTLTSELQDDEHGSALVEGAVLVPMLFVLLFGVYEFSWFVYQQHVISTGLRDAARYLARVADGCNVLSPVWSGEEAHAKNLATTGSINGGSERVRGWTPEMVTSRCTAFENRTGADGLGLYRGGSAIQVVTVSTRFAEPALGFLALLRLPPPIISVSHSERVIGPG
jgi:hypothetical protein